MPFNVGFATDIGKKRQKNQDAGANFPEDGLFVVADGMGGHRGGEIASAMAVELVGQHVKQLKSQGESDPKKILSEAIQKANRAIFDRSVREPALQGMGTTATALLFQNDRLYIGHVGDSRAYLVRPGAIWQLTKDHSFVQEKLRAGLITREQAKNDQTRNVITRSVGFGQETPIEIFEFCFQPNDIFIICSDGLSGQVEDIQILAALEKQMNAANGLDIAVKELVRLANENGGLDNVTVIAVQTTGNS